MTEDNAKPPHVPDDSLDPQKELLEYKKRISNILESFTDAFFEVDLEWTVTYWNKEAERLLIMPREKVLGKNLWEIYEDAVPLKFFSEYHRAMKDNVSVRFEEYFAPREVWLEVAAFPSGNGLSVYFKDITERKKAIILLELERKKYSDLFNLSPVPQWVYEVESLRFLAINDAAVAHYGYSRDEFMQMTIEQIRPAEDLPVLKNILASGIHFRENHKSCVRHQKKNGEVIDVFVEGNTVTYDHKNARMVMVIDRTIEMSSIRAMQESIDRFNIVSKATSDAIWDLNITTGEMNWSQGIRGIFGYEKTVYDLSWWQSRIHPDDLDAFNQQFEMLVKQKEKRLRLEYRFQRADGSYSCVLDRSFVLFNDDGKPVRMIGSMQDITERVEHLKAMEAKNQQLTEIAWIQAHKVRGPLSNILGLSELIGEEQMSPNELKELIAALKTSALELDRTLREIVGKA